MPSIKCRCGNIITKGAIPNPNGYRIFKDDNVENVVIRIRESDEFDAFMTFNQESLEMLKCNVCGRLWIDNNNDSTYASYVREE